MTQTSSARSDLTERQLLQSVVEIALRVFGAAASSIFLIDPETGELVFEAVAGAGQGTLPGTRFPAGTGIAGFVAASGEPLLAEDVTTVPRFARAAAASTGYLPRAIMAAPLILQGECIGVMEVLDPRPGAARDGLQDIELLALVAAHAALSAELLIRLDWLDGRHAPDGSESGSQLALLQRIGMRLPGASAPLSANVLRLLVTADQMLGPS
jgi:GAF domain-containing protein